MKLMIHLIAISSLMLCFCCIANRPIQGNNPSNIAPVIIDKTLTRVFDASHKIDTAFINGNILTMKLSCFNVCETDTFELVGNDKYAKSNPPMTAVFIRRKSHQPNCKSNIQKELKYDVSALKSPSLNKIILNLDEQYKINFTY